MGTLKVANIGPRVFKTVLHWSRILSRALMAVWIVCTVSAWAAPGGFWDILTNRNQNYLIFEFLFVGGGLGDRLSVFPQSGSGENKQNSLLPLLLTRDQKGGSCDPFLVFLFYTFLSGFWAFIHFSGFLDVYSESDSASVTSSASPSMVPSTRRRPTKSPCCSVTKLYS